MTAKTRTKSKMENDPEISDPEISDAAVSSAELSDPELSDPELSETDPEFDLPETMLDMDDDDNELYDILSTLFTTEDGDNVCTALMGIKDALDTQNKILLKLAFAVQKKK